MYFDKLKSIADLHKVTVPDGEVFERPELWRELNNFVCCIESKLGIGYTGDSKIELANRVLACISTAAGQAAVESTTPEPPVNRGFIVEDESDSDDNN